MFMAGEYIEVITSSAVLVALFFGGYTLPFLFDDGIEVALGSSVFFTYKMNHVAVTALQFVGFFAKVILMTFFQIFFRWTLPRFRYDQLMKFGWTKLLPLAIANLIVTAVVVVALDQAPAFHPILKVLGQLTQFVVAAALIALPVGLVWVILRPAERTRFLHSSAARFAAAAEAKA
jgi:NADH-quinone oxidoreductase subunit H